ncbi:iron ABC transporter permease [Georgenia halophila]|uniref:Iron ABC transporter permease n=1 Tax=Georgenia halophila TaxID=620889 RepID=A0ABP8LKT0_9MICO
MRRIRTALANPQVIIAVICVACFVAPAAMIVQGAFKTEMFGDGGEYTTAMFVDVLTSSDVHDVGLRTLAMGSCAVAVSTVVALFFGVLYTKTNTPLRRVVPVIMFVLVATPGLFFAIAWGLLGNQNVGLINEALGAWFGEQARVVNAESWWGIVLVSSMRLVALQFFLLLGPLLAMDRSLEEAARISGAGPVRTFFQMEIPILAPALTGSMILSFVLFLESFDAPQILGVPAGIFVVPTEIYQYLSSSTGPMFGHASSMSVLLMVALLLLVYVQVRVLGKRSFVTVGGKESRMLRRDVGPWRWALTALLVIFAALTIVLPMYQLVRVSLSPFLGADAGFSLENYEDVLTSPRMVDAYANTLRVAVLGAFLAIGASTALSWAARFRSGPLARFIEYSQWLGLAMPGLILALGVLWFFLEVPILSGFYGTAIIMVFALFVAVIPLAGRTTGAAMAQIPRSLEEAAWVSGASKYRAIWDIVVRLMLPSLISGWLLCFVVICGILSTPLVLSASGTNYLSVEIYSRYVEGRAPIAAAASLLLIFAFLVLGAVGLTLSRVLARRTKAVTPNPPPGTAPPQGLSTSSEAVEDTDPERSRTASSVRTA